MACISLRYFEQRNELIITRKRIVWSYNSLISLFILHEISVEYSIIRCHHFYGFMKISLNPGAVEKKKYSFPFYGRMGRRAIFLGNT